MMSGDLDLLQRNRLEVRLPRRARMQGHRAEGQARLVTAIRGMGQVSDLFSISSYVLRKLAYDASESYNVYY